jgi:hypothetical protein
MRILGPIVEPPAHFAAIFNTRILHPRGIGLQPVGDDCLGLAEPPQRLLQERQRRGFVAVLRDLAFQDLPRPTLATSFVNQVHLL